MAFSINNVLIVIVLYNEKLINTIPYKEILAQNNEDINLYVYDNSLLPDDNARQNTNIKYIHDPDNPGVSTAYNYAAAYAQQVKKEWLLLFDQDTVLPVNFIDTLIKNVNELPGAKLYAMRLFKDQDIISPCGYRYKRGFILNNIHPGNNELVNISFLNSGLLVSIDLFLIAGGYDNNVPLYFSDFVFINRLRKFINSFTLLPIDLIHSLSSNDMSDAESFKVRYNLYLKGAFEAMKSDGDGKILYYLVTLLRALKLSFTLKDKYYLENYFRKLYKL